MDKNSFSIEYTSVTGKLPEKRTAEIIEEDGIIENKKGSDYNIFGKFDNNGIRSFYMFECGPVSEEKQYQSIILFRFDEVKENKFDGVGVNVFDVGARKPVSELSKEEMNKIYSNNIHKNTVFDSTLHMYKN